MSEVANSNPTVIEPSPPRADEVPGYEPGTAEQESRYHNYVGHEIPWYVRLIWILFWCYSAWYVIKLLLPALDAELLSPP